MPTPIFLLDTNVALALLRGKELGQYLLSVFSLDDQINRPLISIVSHGELLVLADRNKWGHQKREAMNKMHDSLVTVDLNLTTDRDFVHLKPPSWNVQFIDPRPYLSSVGQ